MFQTFFVALAISLDSFGVGLTFGIKKVKLPAGSILIINIMTILALIISMGLGSAILYFIPINMAKVISGLVLISLGFTYFFQGLMRIKMGHLDRFDPQQELFKFTIRGIKIVISILEEPEKADLDTSGSIDIKESLLLGTALAVDALAVGIGISLAGINKLLVVLVVAITNIILIKAGFYIGQKRNLILGDLTSLLPGLILIFIGITRFF